MTASLIFETPPASAAGRPPSSPLRAWLDGLRDAPGVWAKFPEPVSSGNISHLISKGAGYGVGSGEFESVSRFVDAAGVRAFEPGKPKRFWLYARYVGGAQ